jgi:hypothetical protein
MEQERPFKSPYGSRRHFSDVAPKYLGQHNVQNYTDGRKMLKLAEDIVNSQDVSYWTNRISNIPYNTPSYNIEE